MDIIITGGLGFIGKNFCKDLSKQFERKYIIDKISYASDLDFYYDELRYDGWELIVSDINKIDQYSRYFHNGALIVNFAAESHVDKSFENVSEFIYSNTLGTEKVISFCLSNNHRMLHISTDEVYGEQITNAADENQALTPTNPYAASKAAADLFVQTYITCFNLDAKIVRANNIFGSRQLNEKVIPKAICLAGKKENFFIHGNKNLRRHFLHTSDFNHALLTIIENWDKCDSYAYNVASDNNISIHELVSKIYEFCGSDPKLIRFGKDRPFNDQQYNVNDTKLRSLGWLPQKDFWKEVMSLCQSKSFLEAHF